MTDLRVLQIELRPWQEHNFPGRPAYQPLLGIVEEVGELAHAHLKEEQGIRGTPEEHEAAAMDAVGDVMIYLADYCNARDFDMQEILNNTWAVVKQREWRTWGTQEPRAAQEAPRPEPVLSRAEGLAEGLPTATPRP